MCAAVFHFQSKLFKTIPAAGLLIPIKCPDDKIIEMTLVFYSFWERPCRKTHSIQENTEPKRPLVIDKDLLLETA